MSSYRQIFNSADEAEKGFYKAFSDGSLQAMDNVWGTGLLVCIHPGAAALTKREAVMRSWARILAAETTPTISVEVVSQVQSADLFISVVRELLSANNLQSVVAVLATNIYQRQSGGWKLIEHHGSQIMTRQSAVSENGSKTPVKTTLQ